MLPSQLKERSPFIERQKDLEIQGCRKMVETLLVQNELSRMFLGCLDLNPASRGGRGSTMPLPYTFVCFFSARRRSRLRISRCR